MNKFLVLVLVALLSVSINGYNWRAKSKKTKRTPIKKKAVIVKAAPTPRVTTKITDVPIAKDTQNWGDGNGAKVMCDTTFPFRWNREFQKAFDCNWTYQNPVCGYNYSDLPLQKYANQCTACVSSLKVKYFVKGLCPAK